ncbi:hypothetical protein RB195_004655 [Necator americanus]|uniref:Metalloendopeptidase n=1 Tax=Necator americanus TaxID=51031 RepID=A0ABR1BJ39_NECAM
MIPSLLLVRLIVFLIAARIASMRVKQVNIFKNATDEDVLQLRNKGSKMFNALHSDSSLKWNERDSHGNFVIPFTINANYDESQMRIIAVAMRRIEDNTCIRFKPWTNEQSYIQIENLGGCWADIGRLGSRSEVSLHHSDKGTCLTTGTVMHELMHVIGLHHEHSRYDRDNFVKVHYENIKKDEWYNFEKVNADKFTTHGVPYDYMSIMHYGKGAFAPPGKIAIETFNPHYQDAIGHANDASRSDYLKICRTYQCKQCMGRPTDTIIIMPPCEDFIPRSCKTLQRVVDCSYGVRIFCCATCAFKIEEGNKKSPFNPIFGF